ncbi:xenobiotic reductase [Lichtheimia corymbifera JMRC:FSU:9682]|uniref:Xenobiotic reductase n=1 Tax=Lichtheimia corymbifera JMRC:FSU:9682 TaxID=1263082 RepID=A0A068RWJ3_9FUNG|nr:xenobiotic reductase [Lichtheimia corymbifera JMRC:FSU:9682]
MYPIPSLPYKVKIAPGNAIHPEAAKDVLLFKPSTIRSVTLKNRIVVAPMCMYSSIDGAMNDFHLAHYFSFALRGAGLIIMEATAVEARGRISPNDAGLWKDEQIAPMKRVVDAIKSQGAVAGLQIAHAGRKASMGSPFAGYRLVSESEGGWPNDIWGPSEVPFDEKHGKPHELSKEQLKDLVQKWADTAVRADKAGVEVLEIHSAHGYLLHSFLSGNSNKRTDEYGGSLENRMRFPLEVVRAVRAAWPDHKPLWLRFSSTDFKDIDHFAHDKDGWDVYQAIEYAKELKKIGVDVIDCSAGANLSGVKYPTAPHFQVPFAEAVKRDADIPTAAVGMITEPIEAEKVLKENKADYVLLARGLLRDPNWTMRAARELGVRVKWAGQYEHADKEHWVGKNGALVDSLLPDPENV